MSGLLHYEPITDASLRNEVPWARRILFELVPKLADKDSEIVRFLRMARPPDFLKQLAVREHHPGMADQCCQQLILNRCQVHELTLPPNFPANHVDHQIPSAYG